MELFLSHNPYTIETVFLIDDRRCDAPWFIDLTSSGGIPARLQMWIMHFFDKLHETYPAKEKFYMTFKGTSADCEDIKREAESAETRLGISVVLQVVPCGDPENKFEQLKQLYAEAQAGPYERFHNPELAAGFSKIADRKLAVSIMAPMKNGKSTLLNAILGQELLPNATQRCTAKISYIEHCAGTPGGFEAKKMVKGSSSGYIPCTQEILSEWNKDKSVRHVKIRGTLPGIDISDYRLQFVDTPGPDSAVHPEDQATIQRFLSDNSLPMVCYIIDRVNDAEVRYLEQLKKHMTQFGKQSEDRFIFVVSRMDQLAVSKSDTRDNNPIKSKVEEIRSDLRKIGINNPRILPVSAWIALKAREFNSLDEEDQEEAIDSFKKFRRAMRRIDSTLMDYMSVSPAIKNKLNDELSEIVRKFELDEETVEDNLRYAELLSGIPALELVIEEYLIKYSVPARIYDAASIFDSGIKEADAEHALLQDISSEKTTLAQTEKKISELQNFLVKGKGAKALKAKMFPEEWHESVTLKRELSYAEREFDGLIKAKMNKWTYATLDSNKTIDPNEAHSLVTDFIQFMQGLTHQMLGIYANAVEQDAKEQFEALKIAYEENIQAILGKMPDELREFLNHFDFVLRPNTQMNIKTEEMIVETTEEYIVEYQREITAEKDGLWEAFVSILPFTDTTKSDTRTEIRTIQRVKISTLRTHVANEASIIIQAGLEKAVETAAKHYAKLRAKMMGEFDRLDTALEGFKADLKKNISSQKTADVKLKEYMGVLEWVKRFHERLEHILDLEAK